VAALSFSDIADPPSLARIPVSRLNEPLFVAIPLGKRARTRVFTVR